jgi:predicted phage tail protein
VEEHRLPTTRSHSAKGLTNGTRYYFRIRAHNTAGWSKPSTVVKAVPRTVPTVPRSATATPANTTVKLAWLAPKSSGGAAINKYAVQRSVSTGGPWKSVAYPTTRSHTAKGLTNGTTYYFRIRAHNTAGWGPSSTVVNTVPRTAPTAPQSPTVTKGLYSVYLTWLAPSSTGGAAIDKYIIEHHTDGTDWATVGETTALNYTATGLTGVFDYHYFRIRAYNAAGLGAGSAVVETFALTEPGPPQSPTLTPGNGTVLLTWIDPAWDGGTPIDKFIVQQAINEGQFTTIAYQNAGTYTATVNPGNTYHYLIYAHNAAGNSAPSAIVSVTIPATVPSVATNCDAYQLGGKGSDTLRIDWDPPTNNGGAPILFYDIAVSNGNGTILQASVWSPNTTFDATLPVGTGGWVVIAPYNKVGIGPACAVPVYLQP